jgi:ribosomal protein S18 acetylase RimI-like enzyme
VCHSVGKEWEMKTRPLVQRDRETLYSMLSEIGVFTREETEVAMELYQRTYKFYLRHGFQEVAGVPDYYHPGNDRITFCKRLAGE